MQSNCFKRASTHTFARLGLVSRGSRVTYQGAKSYKRKIADPLRYYQYFASCASASVIEAAQQVNDPRQPRSGT
jgi:hypothetical protein